MKKGLIALIVMLMVMMLLTACGERTNTADQDIYAGKIKKITNDYLTERDTSGTAYQQRIQEADVLMNDGPFEGEIIQVINTMDQNLAYDVELIEGREIYVFFAYDAEGNVDHGLVYDYRRDKYMVYLAAIFLILMIVVGGAKGIRTLITLSLTFVGIFYMLTGIAKGGNPIILSSVVCIIVAVVTMFLVTGFNQKAVSAIIGTVGGVMVSGVIAIIISKMAVLTGLGTTEAQMLMFSQRHIEFDFTSILFASILLGTLGAVMDVCMSIASAINEITEANPFMSTKDLFHSGMNIGRDIMGTMANTLILAYAGTSIFLILVFMMNDIPYFDIVNMDAIATEIVRALGGTIGLILSIPLTAYVAAILEKKNIGNYQ